MRRLVERLQGAALGAGAELREGVRTHGLDGGVLRTAAGDVQADVFVDASGATGARLLGQAPIRAADLCAAAQQVHELADEPAALAWLDGHGAAMGDVLCFTGVAGGYSIVNVRIHDGTVSVLAGSIPALGHDPGVRLIERFATEHRFVGAPTFGGRRAIPLRPPALRIAGGRVAAIGDAADQVHPAHGSGIAQQLLAARDLADALSAGEGVEGYDRRFQRRRAGRLVSSDLFRRFSQTLGAPDLDALMAHGVLNAGVMCDVLRQKLPRPPAGEALRAARGAARVPRLGAALASLVGRMHAIEALYARLPRSDRGLDAAAAVLARLSGRPARLRPSSPG